MPSFPYRPSWSPENAALARHLLIQELDMVLASEHAERAAAMLPNGTLVEVLAGPLTQRLPGGAVQELGTHLAITSITGANGYREIEVRTRNVYDPDEHVKERYYPDRETPVELLTPKNSANDLRIKECLAHAAFSGESVRILDSFLSHQLA